MLFIHEVHQVVGKRERELETAYRDEWMPRLANNDDARLLFFCHQAHGTGPAYRVVTLTAVADGAAYGRLVERVQTGDLHTVAAEIDQYRYDVTGTMLITVPWAPALVSDLVDVPTDGGEHGLSVYMEDTARPHPGMVDAYIEAAREHYAPSLAEQRHGGRSILTLETVMQTAWGAGARRAITLWQKVSDPRHLGRLIASEVPDEFRAPGMWMHDALAVRDDWTSRLLRTAPWSPLY
ncbi:MAG TPA: hypothetical protein VFF40_07830 [Acidimicrobiia bacterium]|nr:hypothetical protein [Acidimicrobiia bacterium]